MLWLTGGLDVEQLEGRIAVVTGGGSGIGRQLVCQLAGSGCHVATCDVSTEALVETRALALQSAPTGVAVLTFEADVADEQQILLFRDAVGSQFTTSHINLLFNNAGISGGGSFVTGDRKEWDQTFAVDWGGIYLCTRVFLPMLMRADEGHLINVSSINGLWASVGPSTPHTAYSTAKFAVRGFTEALITDFRLNAPHLRASVVMPGHIGTSIIINSNKAHGVDPDVMDSTQLSKLRQQLVGSGIPVGDLSDDDLRNGIRMVGEVFRDGAPTSAAEAARIILNGVRNNEWRILVGEDAEALDAQIRADPERVYDRAFWDELRERGLFAMFPG
jgi:NAD(P)-dependent dehydrogenase (short-subunit alcohol dehydrogenase family)